MPQVRIQQVKEAITVQPCVEQVVQQAQLTVQMPALYSRMLPSAFSTSTDHTAPATYGQPCGQPYGQSCSLPAFCGRGGLPTTYGGYQGY